MRRGSARVMRRNGEGPCPWYPNMPVGNRGGWHRPRGTPPAQPRAALTLPRAQLHSQHRRPLELLPRALIPADGPIQLPLQVTQVLRPKTWGWEGWSGAQGLPSGQE